MTIFIALLITVLTFAFVVYPLIRRRPPQAGSAEDGKLGELYSKRDTTYSMLKELEFDFQSGILTEEDYRELEAKYENQALSVLKDIDDLKKGSQPEAEVEAAIERQVQQLRRGKDGLSQGESVD
ncbi:MAG: c-type cytochrome biogenesis protein CcmI [Dehalococcoidales bacterium]